MAHLAIQGHSTRGSEVIALLEMMGGKNNDCSGENIYAVYAIPDNGYIYPYQYAHHKYPDDFIIFTLEEFEEKFPYKVGDMARLSRSNIAVIIKAIKWENDEIVYRLSCDDSSWWSVNNLKPYREKTMEGRPYKELRMPLDDDDKLATEVTIDGNKILPPNGYLIGKITQVDNGMLVEYVKQKPQYPKTYEECCDVLIPDCVEFNVILNGYNSVLLEEFGKLLICRDAYWKLADNWKPDWNNISDKHCIYVVGKEMWSKECQTRQCTLAFPTAEMRNAFYENFKDLIEQCKELL